MTDSCHPPYTLGHVSYVPHRTSQPSRSLADDIILDMDKQMFQELKSMEERIKRHITECKREVIRELLEVKSKKDEKIKLENTHGSTF